MIWIAHLLIVTLLGLVLGSFATALSWRLPQGIPMIGGFNTVSRKKPPPKKTKSKKNPQKKKTKSTPAHNANRSACTSCKTPLGLLDLVPFFSWLCLKGKCRHCGKKISARYPVIEGTTALTCIIFYTHFGWTVEAVPYLAAAPFLISLIAIDLEHKIIPDELQIALILISLCGTLLLGAVDGAVFSALMAQVPYNLVSGLVYVGFAWVLRLACSHFLKKEALGLGDVKFFGVAGFWLGIWALPAFLFLAGISGIVLAVVWKKTKGEAVFPFGPALVLSFVLCMVTNIEKLLI